MIRFSIFTIIVTAFLSQLAHACVAPPTHMYVNHDAAIKDAEWIVLATAKRRIQTETGIAYEMRALEYLKGDGPDVFIVENGNPNAANGDLKTPDEANYFAHKASSFWQYGGKYSNWPDCRIHPGFYFVSTK